MNDTELRERLSRMQREHIEGKIVDILRMLLDRIETIENHLHSKFGERP